MEELDVQRIVDSVLTACQDKGLDSNPVEILRCLQEKVVRGRALDIEDVSVCPEGETNFIIVDRDNILSTALEEIKSLDNMYRTLEVKFYDEVILSKHLVR